MSLPVIHLYLHPNPRIVRTGLQCQYPSLPCFCASRLITDVHTGVVHTVTGAMLMLNTDLHIADLAKHMSRSDFVRNVMRTIRDSTPAADRASTPDLVRDDSGSLMQGSVASFAPTPTSIRTAPTLSNANRSASAPITAPPPSRTDSERSVTVSAMEAKMRAASTVGSSTTISSTMFNKAWESEAEAALRVSDP